MKLESEPSYFRTSTLIAHEIAAFAKLYPKNARPIQPLYNRKLLATK